MNRDLKIVSIFFILISLTFNLRAQDINLQFNPEHGFYNQRINVSITANAQNARIYYTLDGRLPELTASQGTFLYEGPIVINKTSCIRAMAILPDGLRSDVITQTYIFIDDVVQQDYQATINAGFPQRWGTVTPDYGMDPDIVNHPQYGPLLKSALLSLPTMSIVMNIDDLFGSNGIYTNPEQHGVAWERPGSVELIFPDNSQGFQVNCGIRIQGGWFRQHSGTKKHSFRLLFKSQYGPSKLSYPLFGENATDRFDTIVLRAGANDGYAWRDARFTEQYTRDEFGRRLQLATGNAAAHGMFVHLYLNGIYWGLYNPVERPDNSFSASYYGGDKDMWDAINSGEVIDGNDRAWNQLLTKCRRGLKSNQAYLEIQGKNPDGTRNPNFPILIDIQNYIDYLIVQMWGGNWDWPWKNYWIGRDRSEASTGFKFYLWDYENTMGNNRERSPLTMDKVTNFDSRGVGEPHKYLMENAEYKMLFADRVHQLFFNNGILSPASLIDRYAELASQVELAIIAESARWGDQHYSTTPLTQKDWLRERDWILNEYLPKRSDIVLNQFKQVKLYPSIDAPLFYVNGVYQHGGRIASTDQISLTAVDGEIYYTLDGSDPRLSMTIKYLSPFTLTKTTQIKSRVKKGSDWSALNEAIFILPANLGDLRISELHYHPLPQDTIDDKEFEFIELQNSGPSILDLGLARFIQGINYVFPVNTLLQPNEYLVLASNKDCFHLRYGFYPFDVYTGQLDNGGEQIVFVDATGDTLISFRYNDKNPWPESADGKGYSLVLKNPNEAPDYNNPASWRASYRIHGSPGGSDVVPVEDNNGMAVPEEFALLQNYPNPFNSTTMIPFTVSKKSFVSLTIFNMMGQKLATLVHKEFLPGRYLIEWDGDKWSTGVYLLQMKAGNFNRVIKLLLIK